jgi:hypothetical protein
MNTYIDGPSYIHYFKIGDRNIMLLGDVHGSYNRCTPPKNAKIQFDELFSAQPDKRFDFFLEDDAGLYSDEALVIGEVNHGFGKCATRTSHTTPRAPIIDCPSNVWFHYNDIRSFLEPIINISTTPAKISRMFCPFADFLVDLYPYTPQSYSKLVTFILDEIKNPVHETHDRRSFFSILRSNLMNFEKTSPEKYKIMIDMFLRKKYKEGPCQFINSKINILKQYKEHCTNNTEINPRNLETLVYILIYLFDPMVDLYLISRIERTYKDRQEITGFPDQTKNVLAYFGADHIENLVKYFQKAYGINGISYGNYHEVVEEYGVNTRLFDRCIELPKPFASFFD